MTVSAMRRETGAGMKPDQRYTDDEPSAAPLGGDGAIAPDLAFLRTLVDGSGGKTQYSMGQAFVVGGSLLAFQCFANWAALLFWPAMPTFLWLALSSLPTTIFIAYCVWLDMKNRKQVGGNTTSRAIAAAFSAAGISNVALICIFAPAAILREDFSIWMFYPAVVFALQGAAWLTAYQLRKRAWMLGVALGWLASAVALGFLIGTALYLIVAGAALVLFMTVPGVVMMRLSR